MKLRLKLLVTIFSFILLYAIYYWGIPAIVNIGGRRIAIEKWIKNNYGISLKLENPKMKMGLIPSVWFEADDLRIYDGNYYPLEADNLKLKIELLPLIFKKLNIAYLSCDKLNADTRVDKGNRFYIGNYMIMQVSESALSVDNAKVLIQDYNINFKDEIRSKKILMKGKYFNLYDYKPNKFVHFDTNSRLVINGKSSNINMEVSLALPLKHAFETNDVTFDGSVANLNLSDVSPYIYEFGNKFVTHVAGVANIEAKTKKSNFGKNKIDVQVVINNFEFYAKTLQKIKFEKRFSLSTSLLSDKNSLDIKKLDIISGRMKLKVIGKINNFRKSKLNLSIILMKSRAEDIVNILPDLPAKENEINLSAMKKYGLYGDIRGRILITGSIKKPHLNGEVTADNVYVVKPLNIPRAKVNLEFGKDRLLLNAVVPTGNLQKVFVKGNFALYNKNDGTLNITSTKEVELNTTQIMLVPIHEMFGFSIGPVPEMKISGFGNISLKTTGSKDNPLLYGAFNFKDTSASFNVLNAELTNGNGSLYFNADKTLFVTKKAFLNKVPIKIQGKCNLDGALDFDVNTNGQNLSGLIKILKTSPVVGDYNKMLSSIKAVSGTVNISLKLKGKVKDINDFQIGKNINLSGVVKFLGNNFLIGKIRTPLKNVVGYIKLKNNDAVFDLYPTLNRLRFRVSGAFKNNKLYSKINLGNMRFVYHGIPIKIYSGELSLNGDKLVLSRVNSTLETMPVFIDGDVKDVFSIPKFNFYVNTKSSQNFIDRYINQKAIYPLIIKGDVNISSRIKGQKDNFDTQTEVNLEDNSSIYYLGATIGDVENPIRLYLNTHNTGNIIDVKNFQYDKLISSQNNKEFISPQLNAKGEISLFGKNIRLKNFRVKTQNPTDAKVFNILFKKPMIKQGLFSSNVRLNGDLTSPKFLGDLDFDGVDIPLVNITMKDIGLKFRDKLINIKMKGDVFSNEIEFETLMENHFTPPYVFSEANLYFGNLNIDKMAKDLNALELEADRNNISGTGQSVKFNINDIRVKNAKLNAKSVFVKNMYAKDFSSDFEVNSKNEMSLKNFQFGIAGGKVNGDFGYNLKTTKTDVNMHVERVNANSMSEALFDLQNQIYGDLTGQVELSCNNQTHNMCMETLSGNGGFRVVDGKMPKLGSLEYLLKAANLVKSGVTGLTINSIIDLVTPLKTGQFENINGLFNIKTGTADDIQIFSKGKDLSIFITGKYNFPEQMADMNVFGRISKKISNGLGPVGNLSLNTLFNKIPGLDLDANEKTEFIKNLNKIPGFELNNKAYRIFSAQIHGNINGENYVQSFKWVE